MCTRANHFATMVPPILIQDISKARRSFVLSSLFRFISTCSCVSSLFHGYISLPNMDMDDNRHVENILCIHLSVCTIASSEVTKMPKHVTHTKMKIWHC